MHATKINNIFFRFVLIAWAILCVLHSATALAQGAPQPPLIQWLVSTPSSIASGASTTLRWHVDGAQSVTIDPGVGTVAARGQVAISPAATTTYTLTAVNANGSVQKSHVVVVSANPTTSPGRFVNMVSPVSGQRFTAPATLRVFAAAFESNEVVCGVNGSSDRCASRVDFYVDDTVMAQVPASQSEYWVFKAAFGGIGAGTHRVWARAIYTNPAAQLDSEPMWITVDAPPQYASVTTLTQDLVLSGSQSFEKVGAPGARVLIVGNGHRITSASGWTGRLTLKYADVVGLGVLDDPAPGIDVATGNGVEIENSVFEATGTVSLYLTGAATASIRGNEFRSNMLMPEQQQPEFGSDASYPAFTASGPSTAQKFFQGNSIGIGWADFRLADNWLIGGAEGEGNVVIAPRGGIWAQSMARTKIRGNLVYHVYYGGWSQGNVMELNGSSDIVVEHNVIGGGSWPIRGLGGGTLRYNLVIDAGHQWLWVTGNNASVHHNVFVGGEAEFAGLWSIYGPQSVEIYNNTIDMLNREGAFPMRIGELSSVSLHSNAIVNARHPPAVQVDSVLDADYNLFSGQQGATRNYSDNRLPAHDAGTLNAQVDPNFLEPSEPWRYGWDDMWSRRISVSQVLANYRTRYTPAAGSPLIDAGEPTFVSGNDIGAVGAGQPAADDLFGLPGTSTPPPTDTTPPAGSIVINGGAATTAQAAVTLGLAASDDASGVVQMRFSNDGTNFSAAMPFAPTAAWTLASGNGTKTVFAQFRDGAGNWSSATTSDTIVLAVVTPPADTTPPAGTITINAGAATTGTAAVTLTLAATDDASGVAQMRFSNDATAFSAPIAFAATAPWMLTPGDGTKTVFAQFRDGAGNWSGSTGDSIVVVTAAPGSAQLGAHVLYAQNDTFGTNPAITPAITTQATGSTLLALSMGWLRNLAAPIDSFANTWSALSGPNIYFSPDFYTALWAVPSATGGAGHTLRFNKVEYPEGEISMALIEVTHGGKVDMVYSLAPGSNQTPGSITVDGPATLIAIWGGDSAALDHTAVPDNGFTVIDSYLDFGNNGETAVQVAIASKQVTAAGTYTVKWTSTPVQNCACYLIAVRNTVATPPPPAGLVAAYGFNEGQGASAADASGNNLNGVVTNAAWAQGKFGGALQFNGAGDSMVTVASSPLLQLTSAFTLSAWVNPQAAQSLEPAVIAKEGAGGLPYVMYANGDGVGPNVFTFIGGDYQQAAAPATIPANTWTHLAATYDGSALSMYVNGVLARTVADSGAMPNAAGALRIGNDTVFSNEGFAGAIDEVRVYSRALSPAEIQGDMTTPIAPTAPPPPPPPPDTTAPTGTVVINAGDASTTTVAVTLTLAATDAGSGVAQMRFSNDGVTFSTPVAFATASAWTLTGANGIKTVFAQFRDGAGNWSNSFTDTITLALPPPPPPVGLVAAYGFEEGSGTTAADATANKLNGVISNADWVAGKFGKGLSFRGKARSWVTIPDANALDLTTGMTLSAWVKPTSLVQRPPVLMKERRNDLTYGLYANSASGQPNINYTSNAVQVNLNAGGSVPLNQWTHLAGTFDGATLSLYVNGVLVGSKPSTAPIDKSQGVLRIGGDALAGELFSGTIDEVRVYNRALSAAEIQSDMITPVVGASPPPPPADTTPPAGSIAINGGAASTAQPTVTLTLAATDDASGVAQMRFSNDGITFDTPVAFATSAPWTLSPGDGAKTVRVQFRDGAGNWSNTFAATIVLATVVDPPPVPPLAARLLLNAGNLAAVRAAASANTPQWQAFKASLDADLNRPIAGDYQGDHLPRIGDYALGYQALKVSAPAAARNYADKAIALVKSAIRDYPKLGYSAQQYLARGDGSTRNFVLANADYKPASLTVSTCAVESWPMTRDPSHPWDNAGWEHNGWFFQKVSNTSDGPASFDKGADWQHNGDHGETLVDDANIPGNNLVDWSHAARKPANGATYHVSGCDLSSLDATSAWSVGGTTLTFNAAPASDRLVFVSYVYGTSSTDGSSLNYQQTSNNEGGGLASIQIDSTYTARYLGKFTALGLDWLDDYAGFSQSLKNEAMATLVRWSDYSRDFGYYRNTPAGNYGAGHYVSRMFTAVALKDRDPVNGARLHGEMVAFRPAFVIPALSGESPSLRGGFWAGGWGYGQQGSFNDLLAEMAFENAGWGSAASGRTWANQVIEDLIQSAPTRDTIYNQGDIYSLPPAPMVGKDVFVVAAAAASSAAHRGYANHVLQNWPGATTQSFMDMLYRDPSAAAIDPSALQPHYFADGTGLVIARNTWDFASTWMTFQLATPLEADHEGFNAGHMQIQRGRDDLLINANFYGQNLDVHTKSQMSNLVAIDDQGAGIQTYPFNQGFWYGSPGAFLIIVDQQQDYSFASGDYAAAYNNPGFQSPATSLTRDVMYVRPDYVVVHDRVATRGANYKKQLRWHFANAPTISGNSWVTQNGASKLFGATFATVPIATTDTAFVPGDGNANFHQTITQPVTDSTTGVRYITAMQSAPAGRSAMDAAASVVDQNGAMEGVQVGQALFMFTVSPARLASGSVVSYAAGAGSVKHYLTNLQPNRAYALTGATVSSAVSNGKGTLVFESAQGGVVTVQ